MNIQTQLTIWSAIFFILLGLASTFFAVNGLPKFSLEQEAGDTLLAAVGSKATYTGAGTTTFSWMFSSEFGIAVGVLIGVLGFLLNWYYSRRRDQRELEVHRVLMDFHDESNFKVLLKLREEAANAKQ